MAVSGPEIAQAIRATCDAHVAETAAALARAFGATFELQVGSIDAYSGSVPSSLQGPGLGVLFQLQGQGVLFFVPEQCGWLPDGYASAIQSDASRFDRLANDLGAVLLPEGLLPESSHCLPVAQLESALRDSQCAAAGNRLALQITCEGGLTDAWLIWPLESPQQMLRPQASTEKGSEASKDVSTESRAAISSADATPHPTNNPAAGYSHAPQQLIRYRDLEDGLQLLPNYARSLLRIPVGVVVVLAETKKTASKILEICPGTIIQFGKGCDEMLQLEVGGCPIAIGEAVKVGDKFGLRVTSMSMPRPRFSTVRGRTP